MSLDPSINRGGGTFGAALLFAGTCIGAGMLALPLVTGVAGFYPAVVVTVAVWAYMLCTGYLFLEATLWMPDGANVLSMAQRFFGNTGRIVSGAAFLFLYYCLLVAYIAAGAPVFIGFLSSVSGLDLNGILGYLLFTIVFGTIVAIGTKVVDRVNWLLMMGMVGAYTMLIGVGSAEIKWDYFDRSNWWLSIAALPVLFGAFGYHNIVPTVCTYLDRNVKHLRVALILGTVIPLVVYLIWQWLILGIIPEESLVVAESKGLPVTVTLQETLQSHWLGRAAMFFTFFALVTSLLGVALSMVDFIADGLKLKKRVGKRRFALAMVVFIPPLAFAIDNPGIFKESLGIAGGFGEAVLNGLLPIGLVWIGRYRMGLSSQCRLPGGRVLLVILTILTLAIIGLEAYHVLGW